MNDIHHHPGAGVAAQMPPNDAAPPALASALDRLAASRRRLEATWLPPRAAHHRPSAAATAGRARFDSWVEGWTTRLRDLPLLGAALEAAGHWWDRHPWRLAAETVAAELDDAARPWMSRHPLLVLVGAAGMGFAVVATRPWTWPLVAEHVRPLPSRVGRWLLRQLSDAPLQTLLAGLALVGQPAAAAPRGAPEPEHAHDPIP